MMASKSIPGRSDLTVKVRRLLLTASSSNESSAMTGTTAAAASWVMSQQRTRSANAIADSDGSSLLYRAADWCTLAYIVYLVYGPHKRSIDNKRVIDR